MKPGWKEVILALFIGLNVGWYSAQRSEGFRYLQALAEKHEATARYWDTKTNEILTDNTLQRKRREPK